MRPRLTVVGVGGAGCNAVNNMIATGLVGVDFIVANTDAQALVAASTEKRIQLGAALTEGLGAGSRPEIGEAAAEEAIDDIRKHIKGSHMVFIAAGMGGGTGTGAASVIARVARELGILTVGVVTKPFLFEGARRARIAEVGVAELRKYVDTLIVIPNQNLFRIASEKTTFSEAFVMADQVLYSGVACIVDLIIKEGLINLDFADVRTVMSGMGTAMMGTGEASGERRATVAAEEAISNPLLDDVSLRGAKGLLLSITGGPDLTLYEVDEAASRVRQEVDPDANIIVGATYDQELGDRIRVSIVASGMSRAGEAERAPPAPPENWIRATRPGPAQSAPDNAHRAAPHPPPVPEAARGDARRDVHDLQRRLTEALQYAPQSQSRSRAEAWRAPGNVTIEDGPPQLSGTTPPPLPQGYASAQGRGAHDPASGFAPQPPAEVRRPAAPARRASDATAAPPPPPHAPAAYGRADEPYRPPQPASPEPRRRLGLFERLTGRARTADDSPPPSRAAPHSRAPEQGPPPGAIDGATAHEPYPPAGATYAEDAHDVELPVFFRERRR